MREKWGGGYIIATLIELDDIDFQLCVNWPQRMKFNEISGDGWNLEELAMALWLFHPKLENLAMAI